MRVLVTAAIATLLRMALLAAQECSQDAPCTEGEQFASLINVLSEPRVSQVYQPAMEPCGGPLTQILLSAVTSCRDELSVPAGCACDAGPGCTTDISQDLPPACLQALVRGACDSASWFEPEYGVNLRNLMLHLANDCANQTLACGPNVAPFDPSVCADDGTTSATAPAAEPSPALVAGEDEDAPAANTTVQQQQDSHSAPVATQSMTALLAAIVMMLVYVAMIV